MSFADQSPISNVTAHLKNPYTEEFLFDSGDGVLGFEEFQNFKWFASTKQNGFLWLINGEPQDCLKHSHTEGGCIRI